MIACHVPMLRSTRSSCNSNPPAALARGAAVPRCSQAAASSRRAPCLQCHGRRRSNASSTAIDAKGLSYLGDSIWTLCVRRHFFAPPKHWKTYQDLVQPYVTAEGQAAMYDALLSGAAGATAAEQQMLTTVRAQASNWRLRKRFESAEGADAYRKATAFEALVGHLHLTDPDRLMVLTEALLVPSTAQQDTAGSDKD